jgi:cytochrome c-type biogenesis protein CcmH
VRRWLPWLALAVVLAGALVVGTSRHQRATDLDSRTRSIAAEVRCPTCQGQSAADSQAEASRAIRDEIRARLQAGESAGQIKGYLVSRYGQDIVLDPQGSGFSALVWALPVAAFVVAAAALAFAFSRWRARAGVEVSPADRLLVDAALRR